MVDKDRCLLRVLNVLLPLLKAYTTNTFWEGVVVVAEVLEAQVDILFNPLWQI